MKHILVASIKRIDFGDGCEHNNDVMVRNNRRLRKGKWLALSSCWAGVILVFCFVFYGCGKKSELPSNPADEAKKDVVQTEAETEYVRPTQTIFTAPVWTTETKIEETNALQIIYPKENAMFPPEIIAPTFRWKDGSYETNQTIRWAIRLSFPETNISLAVTEPWWRPESMLWTRMKQSSTQKPFPVQVVAYDVAHPEKPLHAASVRIRTSTDEVGAEIFYREVNLPFLKAAIDPSLIRWRAGSITNESMPKIVLERLPVCGNCHSFSRDSSFLAMDVDYANTKASYVVTPTAAEMKFSANDIISWNQYKEEDGVISFGLLSQIAPDGRYVMSSVKDSSVFVDMPGLDYSQLFFPIKGVLVYYDRTLKKFHSLTGADDPKYVQANPVWSPDGKEILFARTDAYDLLYTKRGGRVLLTRDECREFTKDGKPFQYDIYRIPFNEGKGGTPMLLEGASGDGKSNFFPRYSPDGKWIVFCKAQNYMLLQPDSKLYIIPVQGGTPRLLEANLERMNSWHSWSPNSRWLVFSSKENGPYTQLWLTHIDEQGVSTPPVLLENFTCSDRAANIPEFYRVLPNGIQHISSSFLDESSFVRAGTVFYYNKEWEQAVTQFRKALEINPKCVEALHRLGYIEFFVYDHQQEGMACTAKAVELDPSYAFSQYDYGVECMLLGQFKLARQHLKNAIELIPDGFDALYNAADMRLMLADTCLYDRDLEEAKWWGNEVLKMNPDHAAANYKMALYLTLGNEEEQAIQYMDKALAIDSSVDTSAELHQYIGLWYRQCGQKEDAKRELARAIELATAQKNTALVEELNLILNNLQ